MSSWAAPIGYALFLWWFSTGVILLADRLPKVSARGSLIAATLFACLAVFAIIATRDVLDARSAFIGFTAGVVLWGWHEVAFLSGLITGPRRTDCPQGAKGWQRFVLATQTLIHHEVAIAVTVVVLAAFLWSADNMIALWTFMVLWGMRLSTKFNIFLGVPNVTEEFLPSHLNHLKSYFRTRPLNLLFPLSITLGSAATFWLAHFGLAAGADPFTTTCFLLLATLSALGVVEHWFLVLPLRDAELWRWYLKTSNKQGTAQGAGHSTTDSSFAAAPFVTPARISNETAAFRAQNAIRGHQQ